MRKKVKGAGRAYRARFDIEAMGDGTGAEAIREAHGRSLGIGVDGGFLPIAEGARRVIHGANQNAAIAIIRTGVKRMTILHIS